MGAAGAGVRIRTVALPNEHGGWGLALEPVALGLLVAPSPAGCFLAVATLGAFLARHPFKIAAGDRRRGRRFPRTAVAERFALLYACLALAGLLAAATTAASYQFILPLLLAAPFAAVQLVFDATGRSRALAPELAGSFGLAAVSTSIALADGRPLPAAFGLWVILASRVVPTILYVRARLQLKHGETPGLSPVFISHVGALGIVVALALMKVAPLLAVPALLVLLLRAAFGCSETAQRASAKQIGIGELAYGAMTVLAVAAGHLLAM
ncbi:MAG TPA: YwiC-like family protein [Pyrinomonadaceae bacterium]|nr:YwiC-like family protein [Pyrinomonadaceae bacterium]